MTTSALISAFMKDENIAFTENGARTNTTSFSANLDFFALASAKRNDPSNALILFVKAFNENPTLAMRNLFYLRDIRGGQGERDLFRICFANLLAYGSIHMHNMISQNNLLELIPEYGRWDDLISLLGINEQIDAKIVDILKDQILSDYAKMSNKEGCSLLAKWFPLANSVSNPTRKIQARLLAERIFKSPRDARLTITALRRYLQVLEQKMSAKDYDSITYDAICSKAHMKYRMAFLRHDENNYKAYLEAVKEGKKKINASTIYPYEIVGKYLDGARDARHMIFATPDETLEELWKALPDYTNGYNSLCVVDVSGSMYCNNNMPINVAVSLGIYFAERNTGIFHNHFITFSTNPKFVELKDDTLCSKAKNMSKAEWGMGTNINIVFEEILSKAVNNDISEKDMPKTVYIISDMEFNDASTNETNFKKIKHDYAEYGYTMPTLVFWNVASRGTNVPVTKDENGTVMVSGCSPVIFEHVTTGKTPEMFMFDVLNSERYEAIKFD